MKSFKLQFYDVFLSRPIGEFHAFPIKKTKWDVDNGHSKECRSFRGRWSTLQHFQDSVLGRVYAGLRRCMQARSHPEHAAAKRGHHRLFFFLVREKGGFVRTLRTPLGYVPADKEGTEEKTRNKKKQKKKEQVLSCWVVIIIPIPLPQHQHTFCQRHSLTKSVLVLRERNWY